MKKILALALALCLILTLVPAAFAAPAKAQIPEEGDWYGWWIVEDASEDSSDLVGSYFDLCAEIEYDTNNTIDIKLWDESYTRTSLEGEMIVVYDTDSKGNTSYETVLGAFAGWGMTESTVLYGKDAIGYDDLLAVEDFTVAYDDSWVSGTMYLRPWGTDWSDLLDSPVEADGLYADMTPKYYDWYTQLVDDGLDMPGVIGQDGVDPSEPNEAPLVSGAVFIGSAFAGDSTYEIDATGADNSAYIKLKTEEGITLFSFYVEAGSKVTVNVPDIDVYVCVAEGKDWQGTGDLFGKGTVYTVFEEMKEFSGYSYSYSVSGSPWADAELAAASF